MTYAPPTITAAMKLWTDHGGVNLGIVGDAPHAATGQSYHLGKSQLRSDAYSRVLARDRAGLSEAASAMDLGKVNGSLAGLQRFSVWLVAQVRANPSAYRDIREVIYSPDGTHVKRWDNELKALRDGGTGSGQGDDTHLWHTHISFYRDSEFRAKVQMVAPYWEGDTVESKPVYEQAHVIPLKLGAWLHWFSDLRDDARNVRLDGPGREKPEQRKLAHVLTYTQPKDRSAWPWAGGVFMVAYEPVAGDTNTTSRGMFVRSEDLAGKPEAVAPPEPVEPVPGPATPDVPTLVTVTVEAEGVAAKSMTVEV